MNIDASMVRKLLDYKDGTVFWKWRIRELFSSDRIWKSWNTRYAGREGFTAVDSHGYRQSKILSQSCLLHKAIWAWHYGEWPEGEIDHINSDKLDNRIENLRIATRNQNVWNTPIRKDNTSGYKGVSKVWQSNKWQAHIDVYGEVKYLGVFSTAHDAGAAYEEAAIKYHGDFARTA